MSNWPQPDDWWIKNVWPKALPCPTEEEWQAASDRLNKAMEGRTDDGDFGRGITFTCGMFAPFTWIQYFYPNENHPFRKNPPSANLDFFFNMKYPIIIKE